MDCSQLVLSVIKDDSIKKNLNPIVYYCIKLIYDPEFSNRSRLFCRCIKNFFDKSFNLFDLIFNINLYVNWEKRSYSLSFNKYYFKSIK